MEGEQRVGIATVVMRNKQYLCAIRPLDGALAMSTMRFADEVVPRSDIDDLPRKGSKPDAKQVRLAKQILDALASDWDPGRYRDTYTDQLKGLIEKKAKGEAIEVEEPEDAGEKVLDLMAAMEQSLALGKGARSGGGRAARGRKAAGPARTKSASSRTTKKASTGKAAAKKPARKAAERKSA
jgi:DNA end-binding protein Ku